MKLIRIFLSILAIAFAAESSHSDDHDTLLDDTRLSVVSEPNLSPRIVPTDVEAVRKVHHEIHVFTGWRLLGDVFIFGALVINAFVVNWCAHPEIPAVMYAFALMIFLPALCKLVVSAGLLKLYSAELNLLSTRSAQNMLITETIGVAMSVFQMIAISNPPLGGELLSSICSIQRAGGFKSHIWNFSVFTPTVTSLIMLIAARWVFPAQANDISKLLSRPLETH